MHTLGLPEKNIVFSDYSSEEMFAEGGKYGSIDPCYPAKVTQAHVHNLLFHKHTETNPLHYVFFPILTHLSSSLEKVVDTACCPIVAGTPEVMKAAFTKETNFFADRSITYLDPALTLNEPTLFKKQMFQAFGSILNITEDESDFAVDQAWKALEAFDTDLQTRGRKILDWASSENKMVLLMLGRPYHLDPGLNHDVYEEFQTLGYPILSMRSIPKDDEFLDRYFGEEVRAGIISSPHDITDVWPENYSANSAQKVWAAKFAARHPNVAILDLSSFKCGHDAPTYGIIDKIISTSGTAYSALHDIDANKPTGSIKIRTKTYAYTLKRREEMLEDIARNKVAEGSMPQLKYQQIVANLENTRLASQQKRIPYSTLSSNHQTLQKEVSHESFPV
ncbi:MAG: hypothetical protein ACD_73C00743G0001 [uncultured bacterium]|nr:MAG: hypothetical protein ACD_73C00743G0001 [uncultured bacterium]